MEQKINAIRGKVILKETGLGIPNLVVVIYDLDPGTKPEELFELYKAGEYLDLWTSVQGDRLGSVVTTENGTFELIYKDDEFSTRNRELRPDLLLLVMAPEEPLEANCPPILHVSCGIRQNAGRIENFVFQIPTELLEKSGVRIPGIPFQNSEQPEKIIERMKEQYVREEALREGQKEITRLRVATLKNRQAEVSKILPNPVKVMSRIPENVRKTTNYIEPDENITDKTFDMFTDAINSRISSEENPEKRTNLLRLTDEQMEALTDERGEFRVDIPGHDFRVVFGEDADPFTIDLVNQNLFSFCLPESKRNPQADACLQDGEDGTNETNETEQPVETAQSEEASESIGDIPKYVTNLLETMTSPEVTVRFEPMLKRQTRATQGEVQKKITKFELQSGPADTPAFYDFHHLQIAFEPVWREVFDEKTFDLIKKNYTWIEDLGGVPGDIFRKASTAPEELCRLGEQVINANNDDLTPEVIQIFAITTEQWMVLTDDQQKRLEELADDYLEINAKSKREAELEYWIESYKKDPTLVLAQKIEFGLIREHERKQLAELRQEGNRIIDFANVKLGTNFNRYHDLLKQLCEQLKEPYSFTIYAANKEQRSVNFGILVTYRQKWEPINYQVGELVKSIPLAPKEVRKFSKKVIQKKRRSEKEVTNNLRSKRDESAETTRAEQEIVRKANIKTNFHLSTESDFDILIASGKATTKFDKEDAENSEEVKKDFREAIVKSAEEYKQEHTIEVNTEETEDVEVEESGEISNPNDELPVTFLFYELQRRYRISERIHRVRPVIFVAQEVPYPHEIDEDWLVAYDWILRRVILDDSFIPALNYLSTGLVGDEFALVELHKTMLLQRKVAEDIKEEVAVIREQAGRRYAALEGSIQRRADVIEEQESEGFFEGVWEGLTGSGGESEGAARTREDAAKDAYERAAKEEKEQRARLEREITALNAATETYTKALSEHLNRKTQISRLRVHVKQNILYYMQAIWNHEPPDQRYFRLHTVKVPKFSGQLTYNVSPTANPTNLFPNLTGSPVAVQAECKIDLPLEETTLAEVADLDNLLGYKGNYMVFPIKEGNCLTEFMMTPYIDAALGLHDPDELGNWTLEEFAEYVCCLKENLDDDVFGLISGQLRQQYLRLLSAPRRLSEEIIVPTGSLYIEALPGSHPILEDFKLQHRAIDVKKVQAEVRKAEMENLRLAARLLTDELEDPDIEKKIIIEGNADIAVDPENDTD